MTPEKPEPPSPSTDKPEQEQPNPEKTEELLPLNYAPPGSKIRAVTFPSGLRWEFDENGNKTEFKPQ